MRIAEVAVTVGPAVIFAGMSGKTMRLVVQCISGLNLFSQNYIPGNVDPKDDGAQDVITGAEPGGENVSGADRCVEEEAGRIRSITCKK